MKKNKNKKSKIVSGLKRKWVEVPQRDRLYWLGEFLLASMVLNSWDTELGSPTHIGRIKDMKECEDGTGLMEFEAKWVE